MYSLSSVMILSARTRDGQTINRQHNMHPSGIQLEKLSRLNDLSRKVCADHPAPARLMKMLDEAVTVKEYPTPVVLAGQMLAMACLCRMFEGNFKDMLVALVITVIMFLMGMYVKKPWLNNIVYNAVTSCIAGLLGIISVRLGLADHIYTLMITNSMMLIPGVPLVNATYNLFCGNEMNGILELMKVVIETLAVVGGFVAAIFFFGGMLTW